MKLSLPKTVTDLHKRYAQHPQGKKVTAFFAKAVVRRVLLIAAGIIVFYALCVGSTGYFIFHRHAHNRWTGLMERLFPYPAAVAHGTVIPMKRFRLEVAAREHYAAVHNLPNNTKDTEQFVMDKLTNDILYDQALIDNKILVHDSDVEAKLNDIYKEVGGQDKLVKFLRENYGDPITLDQFRIWIHESLVESAIQHQLLTEAKVRHILIALPDTATEAQVSDAKKKIDDLRAHLAPALDQFSADAKLYSEDISSRDNGGNLGTTIQGSDALSFSADFEKAVFSLPVGQLSQPVRSRYGWHLIIVDSRSGSIAMSLNDYTQKLRKEGTVRVFYKI